MNYIAAFVKGFVIGFAQTIAAYAVIILMTVLGVLGYRAIRTLTQNVKNVFAH